MRWFWSSKPAANVATEPVAASLAPVDPSFLAQAGEVVVKLARDSFAIVTNPRRRRQRRGSGHYHRDYQTVDELRRVSRWQEDHAGTYAGPLANWETFLIGTGPEWVPSSGDTEWDQLAAALIKQDLIDRKHDARRRWDWGPWLKILARSIVRDGQMGVAHSANGAAQLIEAERIVDVDTTSAGQVVHWKIADWKLGQLNLAQAYPVAASMIDVCQVVTRTSQWFGVPLACSTLDDHDGIADLWASEIDTAAEAVRPWLTVEHQSGASLPGGQTIPQALAAGQPTGDGVVPGAGGRDAAPAAWIRTPNGNIMGVPKGLTAKPHQPMRPNLDVPEFSKQMLRIFSIVLLPYELLFMDHAGINHSNGRSIVRIGNALLGNFWATYLDRPATRIVHGLLRSAMQEKRLPWNPNWRVGSWQRDLIPEHDRFKERQADAIDLENGTTNLRELCGERWLDIVKQAAAERLTIAKLDIANIVAIQELCEAQNTKLGSLNLHWSQIVALPGAKSNPGALLQGAATAGAASADPAAIEEPTHAR